jgi:hypothetical protein
MPQWTIRSSRPSSSSISRTRTRPATPRSPHGLCCPLQQAGSTSQQGERRLMRHYCGRLIQLSSARNSLRVSARWPPSGFLDSRPRSRPQGGPAQRTHRRLRYRCTSSCATARTRLPLRTLLDPRQEDTELRGRETEMTTLRILGVTHPDPGPKTAQLNAVLVVSPTAVRALAPLNDHEYRSKYCSRISRETSTEAAFALMRSNLTDISRTSPGVSIKRPPF